MGHNSTKFDKDAHYASKSTKQLEELVVFWKEAIAKHPEGKMANEELGLVQMKLAERIGKKGAK
jgi:hypothetical protein